MENKYIIGDAGDQFQEGNFKFVIASSPNEAMSAFVKYYGINDRAFRDYVYEKIDRKSFAGQFLIEDDNSGGKHLKDGVREFFKHEKEFAEIYIDYFFDESGPTDMLFPLEMLVFIYLNDNACDFNMVSVFSLSDKKLIVRDTL